MMEKKKDLTEEIKEKEAEQFKKEKDNAFYWAIALIFAVIILFFAANKFYSNDDVEYKTITYHNWEFTEVADLWWFEWQKGDNVYQVPLRFNPYEVNSVKIKGMLNEQQFNSRKEVYVTFDLSNESIQNFTILALAATELTQNIATALNRTPVASCTTYVEEVCDERPIRSCKSIGEPVIYLSEGGETGIFLEGSCITLQGENFELLKSVDRLLYQWYGVMKDE